MSILLFNFKELTKNIEEVERIEERANSKNKELTKKEGEEEVPSTLDSYFIKNNASYK